MLTRRQLLLASAVSLPFSRALAGAQAPARETVRPDVAVIDHDHIEATSARALATPPSANLFSGAVPALAAGSLLFHAADASRAATLRSHAAAHLRYLFITPATQLNNELAPTDDPALLLPLLPLGEIARAAHHLALQAAREATAAESGSAPATAWLNPSETVALRTWFSGLLHSFLTSRTGGLARDRKDHVGATWLFVATAMARLVEDDVALTELRHQFRTSTIRAEILAGGTLPHELTTRNPYRNSLFALDCLAAACDLLSTRFQSLWDVELQDGPGLRVAVAKHAPWIADRSSWPYPADSALFHDLPCRRIALLLGARAYQRPEYASIWRSTPPTEPSSPELLTAFPVRQPLLWSTRIEA